MTEGPRTEKYPGFTDSYKIIMDTRIDNSTMDFNTAFVTVLTSKVIVCSILMTMQPPVLSSQVDVFVPEYTNTSSSEKKPILFHEQWLDGTNWLRTDYCTLTKDLANENRTLPSRDMSVRTGNAHLARFGEVLGRSLDSVFGQNHSNVASNFKTIVSGAFLSVYPCITHSDSQYPLRAARSLPLPSMPVEPLYHPNAIAP